MTWALWKPKQELVVVPHDLTVCEPVSGEPILVIRSKPVLRIFWRGVEVTDQIHRLTVHQDTQTFHGSGAWTFDLNMRTTSLLSTVDDCTDLDAMLRQRRGP